MDGGLRHTMNFAPAQYANILFMWAGIKQNTAQSAGRRWTEVLTMDDEKCPCETCPTKDNCDGWEAAFCCTLCEWQGGGDCDHCDPWDI